MAVAIVLFMGIRYRVGMDWNNYDAIHNRLHDTDFSSLLGESEPLSQILMWVSSNSGTGMLITNLFSSAVLVLGVAFVAYRTSNPFLGILVALPYLLIAFGMSGVRQAIAIGIGLLVFSRWAEWSIAKKIIVAGLGALFHTSGLFVVAMVLIDNKFSMIPKVMVAAAAVGAVTYSAMSVDALSDNFAFYSEVYLSGADSITSPGAILHMSLVQIPALAYLAWRRHLEPFVPLPRLMLYGSVVALGVFGLYAFSSTAASRIIIYLYFVPIFFYPAVCEAAGWRQRDFALLMLSTAQILTLVLWLLYANNSFAHLPYRTILAA